MVGPGAPGRLGGINSPCELPRTYVGPYMDRRDSLPKIAHCIGGIRCRGDTVNHSFLVPLSTLGTVFSSDSFSIRTEGWGLAWRLIVARPFGQGLGTAGAAANKITPGYEQLSRVVKNPIDGAYAHALGFPYQPDNYYVKMLIELGPIGVWLFVMFLVCAVFSGANIARRAQY